ncbi:MAG: hypothetical protein ACFFD2_13575 [Promethearchaeota archaeon]
MRNNEMQIKKVGCLNVGLKCGGWARIIIEIKIVDRNTIKNKNLG